MSNNPVRRWRQILFATAILLVFVTAGLFWKTLKTKEFNPPFDTEKLSPSEKIPVTESLKQALPDGLGLHEWKNENYIVRPITADAASIDGDDGHILVTLSCVIVDLKNKPIVGLSDPLVINAEVNGGLQAEPRPTPAALHLMRNDDTWGPFELRIAAPASSQILRTVNGEVSVVCSESVETLSWEDPVAAIGQIRSGHGSTFTLNKFEIVGETAKAHVSGIGPADWPKGADDIAPWSFLTEFVVRCKDGKLIDGSGNGHDGEWERQYELGKHIPTAFEVHFVPKLKMETVEFKLEGIKVNRDRLKPTSSTGKDKAGAPADF